MKTTAIASECLFAAGPAAAECVTVEQVQIYQPSPARVRITALVNGQPLANTQISIFSTAGPQRRISTSMDRRGVATTAKLPAGPYQVVANAEGDLFAQLYLDVSSARRNRAKSFSMNLAPCRPVFPPRERFWRLRRRHLLRNASRNSLHKFCILRERQFRERDSSSAKRPQG